MWDTVSLILQNFFITLGLFYLVRMLLPRPKSNGEGKSYAKVNGELFPMKDIVIAQAEYIDQSGYKGWLLWDLPTNKFLGQSTDPAKCVSMLQERFPGKTIFIKGLPE